MDSITLRGTLHSFDGVPLKKEQVDIYDTNENLLTRMKTNKLGQFAIPLPLSMNNKEMDIRFRVSTEHAPQQDMHAEDSSPYAFPWNRHSVKEDLIVPLRLDANEICIGKRDMENIYEKEHVTLSYLKDIGFAAVPALLQGADSKLKHMLGQFDETDIQEILDEFDVSSIPLTSDNTWKFITNGICPTYFQKQGQLLVAEINWNRYEFDKLESLPNIKLNFRPQTNGEGTPRLERIEVQFRKTLNPSHKSADFDPPMVYTPEDANFSEGLRAANSVFHLYGQAVFHLAIGHVYGAKVAQLVEDYLKDTKLGELLQPHCRNIRTISNVLGDDAIFGTNGVLNCSGLSVGGIVRRINDTLAALDPFTYKPRQPINQEHTFAIAQNIYYKSLSAAIDEFMTTNRDQIVKEWHQVHRFFYLMHKSSPLYRPWDGVDPAKTQWQSGSEIGLNADQVKVPARTKYRTSDADVRSFRWIARNQHGPEGNDMEMVAAFITDYIHRVTFYHSWIHQTQFGQGGFTTPVAPHVMDANFSPITLANNGQGPYGSIGKKDLIQQEETVKIFRSFKGEHYTLLNDKDVHPGIVAGIEKIKDDLLKCNFDASKGIYYSTVI
jgi:hypothetical protein